MPANKEIVVFCGAPIHAAFPRLQVGAGETRVLLFRVFEYGGRGVKDLSSAAGIALVTRPVMESAAYPSVFSDPSHPLADWANGKIAIEVGPTNVTNTENSLNMSLVQLDADGHPELIARGFIEVLAVPSLESGSLVFPGAPTAGSTGNRFTFEQSDPSADWLIEHNLNGYPAVLMLGADGVPLVGDATYIDQNTVRVAFANPTSGFAYLN